MNSSNSAREFKFLRDALNGWSVHSHRPQVWVEIDEIIQRLTAELGNVIRIHIPFGESYIGITFEREPTKIGAYIGAGRIDHIVKINGSFVPDSAPSYWRSELSTVGPETTKTGDGDENELVVCPNGCGLKIRTTAECSCGWKFGDEI